MLTEKELERAIAKLPLLPFQEGTTFRLVHIKYWQEPMSSIGSLRVGGRYNIKDSFTALYTANTPITALRELRFLIETPVGLIPSKGDPYVLLSIDYQLRGILDLTNFTTQQALGTNLQELTGVWLPQQLQNQDIPTQLLGWTAYSSQKIEALKVPCTLDSQAYNLVIFSDKLSGSGSFLQIYDNSGTIRQRIP